MKSRNEHWYVDESEDAGVIVLNNNVKISQWGRGRGFVWIKAGETYIYSVYISPNASAQCFDSFLQELGNEVDTKGTRVLIGGDFNSKSPMWGSPHEDRRGKNLVDWIHSRSFAIMNAGDKPTFTRDASQSHIDVTMASEEISRTIRDWRVLDEETASLHNYIAFTVGSAVRDNNGRRWKNGKLDGKTFTRLLNEELRNRQTLDIKTLMYRVRKACRGATPRVRLEHGQDDVYWWTLEIEEARKASLQVRRQVCRLAARAQGNVEELTRLKEVYREKKRVLRGLIRKQKRECWKNLCMDVDSDIWGLGYKIVRDGLRIRAPKIDLDSGRKMEIARRLFPADAHVWERTEVVCETCDKIELK